MSDLISRQAAIDALNEQIEQCDKALSAFDISMKDAYAVKVERATLVAYKEQLEFLPSAQPYSDDEIQNMQDLEQAQFDKAYQIGYEEGKKDAQPEPLTDTEQRIFLAAMSREEKVCKNIDEELPGPYTDSLFKACREIERKVKKALWTN